MPPSSDKNVSANEARYIPRAPKAKPLFPDVEQSSLPEILQVDARVAAEVRRNITAALEGSDTLHLNASQIEFAIVHTRYCIEQNISGFKNDVLTAAALHFLAQRPTRDPQLLHALQGSKTISAAANNLKGKEARVKIINDPLENTQGSAPAAVEPASHYIKEAQESMRMGNYDDAIMLIDHCARVPHPTTDALLCGGMMYTLRATKKPCTPQQAFDDLGAAMEYFDQFMMRTRNMASEEKKHVAVRQKIAEIIKLRANLSKRISK